VERTVSKPGIPTQRPRLCPRCGFELVLDLETARTSIDAGWPAVELYTCRLGHSQRVWPIEAPMRPWDLNVHACAVCGRPLPPLKDRYAIGGRKYHAGPCTVFASRERTTWSNRHRDLPFVLEAMPWYKGPLAPVVPLPPLDPLAGRMPRDWAAGWRRVYGDSEAERA